MLSMEDFAKMSKEEQDALMVKMGEIQKAAIANPLPIVPQLTMEGLENMFKATVEKYLKPMDGVDRKFFAFPGIGNDPKLIDDKTPEGKFKKTRMFLKALVNGDLITSRQISEEARVKANLSEGTTTAGGFLVPEEFKAEILRLMPTYGVARRNCRIIPMTRDIMNIPAAGTTNVTAQWVNEAAQILSTDPTFRQVILTVNKLGSIPKVTNELLDDANVDVISYLSEIIAEAFAEAEDKEVFCGVGSPFVGCLTATGVPTYPHASGTGIICLSYADLVSAPEALYENARAGAKWYLHRSIVGHIKSLITTAGAPLFPSGVIDIGGYPYERVEVLPNKTNTYAATDGTAYMIFGDLGRGVALGDRGAITMQISREATVGSDNLFEKDMAALRMIERICVGVLLPSSFIRIVT